MLNIDEELKRIYKNDIIPLNSKLADKQFNIYFPNLDLTIRNDRLKSECVELTDSICSDKNLVLGSCESAQIKFIVADVIQDLTDEECIITQLVNDTYTMPYGTYKVESTVLQSDKRFKEIKAYDSMKKFDVDVSSWYNSLTFPISLRGVRESLCRYLNIECLEQNLQNDTILIYKTIEVTQLIGRTIMQKITELNGGFGYITRDNKFKVINLSGLGLYPSETLYPKEDLFPSESSEFLSAGYKSIDYEEYIVESITGIKISQEDGDIGATVGTNDNVYNIMGNFLVYGKSTTELEEIANNILLVVKNKYYRPHKTTMIGLPYLEPGDAISIITGNDAIETFVFQRTLKGIQALTDEIEATGDVKLKNEVTVKDEITQLKGKSAIIKKSIEELSSTMTDMGEGLQSQITQTAGQLQTQITDTEKDLQSQITQNTGQILQAVTDVQNDLQGQIDIQAGIIDIKVNNNGIIAAINLSQEGIKIDASKLTITGFVTFNDLSNSGSTTINGDNVRTGKIEGVTYKTVGSRGTITMQDGYFHSQYSNLSTWIEYGFISVGNGTNSSQMSATYVDTPNLRASEASITTLKSVSDATITRINGFTPVTYGNTANLIVGTAERAFTAGSASSLDGLVRMSGNNNFIPNQNGIWNGTSGNPWAGGYGTSGWSTTSDERKKDKISNLDERFLRFAKTIIPRRYQMLDGASGRFHTGLIAQEVEQAMIECGISDMEFAGLVKAPIYANKLANDEYDTTSEIIDYDYYLRYEEFVPLLFLYLNNVAMKTAI